jgi:hypothetical protein
LRRLPAAAIGQTTELGCHAGDQGLFACYSPSMSLIACSSDSGTGEAEERTGSDILIVVTLQQQIRTDVWAPGGHGFERASRGLESADADMIAARLDVE